MHVQRQAGGLIDGREGLRVSDSFWSGPRGCSSERASSRKLIKESNYLCWLIRPPRLLSVQWSVRLGGRLVAGSVRNLTDWSVPVVMRRVG